MVFVYCKHNDCDYYISHNGDKRRILGQLLPLNVDMTYARLKCKACAQISSFSGKDFENVDKAPNESLESLLEKNFRRG